MLLTEIPQKLAAHPSGLVVFVESNGSTTKKTFGELCADVGALASSIRRAGLAPGARVGIVGRNSYAWMVWDLALASLELISVAIPDELAARGARDAIDRYELALVASDDARWCELPAVVELTHDVQRLPAVPEAWAPARRSGPDAQPSDCLTMTFSSGTTGRLKGLYIARSRVERVVAQYAEAFAPADGDRHLIFIPFTNFQQRLAYYGCLYHGVDVVIAPTERLFAALAEFHPTFLIGPPMLYETFRAAADQGGSVEATRARLGAILGGNMRYMITGMAPIKRATLEFYQRHGVALYEAYGCTEAGMIAWNRPGCVKLGTVGKPIQPNSVRIADNGEVLVVDESPVSLGYFDVPAHEAERVFVSATVVATGDIGSIDDQGFLTLHGRLQDAIVLPDGRKFHPESIEAMLEANPLVSTAVVYPRDGAAGLTALIQVRDAKPEAVRRGVHDHVTQLNATLDPLKKVVDVRLIDEPFAVENGTRTANLKLNRRAIRQRFAL